MAEKKQTVMVLREDEAAAPAVAPTTAAASSFFTDPKPGQTIEGGKDLGALEASGEPDGVMKPSPGSVAGSPYAVTSSLSDTNPTHHPENLPPEATSRGITVTLDNNNMWNEFFRCKTEMILTKQGRRMFPSCRYRISGMEPFQSYLLIMDITPMDNHRYKWSDHRWEPNGKCEPHVSGRVFIHPESPASGHYWMQSPVSFYKLKLTNNVMDQEGHVILHSMHRYLPRLHIVPADKQADPIDINGPDVMTFIFPQTEFFAVTAYQNLSITQLKIDYNPFAKGFREDASNFRSLMPKLGSPSVSVEGESKNNKELGPIKNSLKALFTKKVLVGKNTKEQGPLAMKQGGVDCKDCNMQPSVVIEKCILKRRPSTLSELFQGTPLKLRKAAPESSGPSRTLQKTDNGSVDPQGKLCLKEAPQKSVQEDVQENSLKEDLPTNVKTMEDSEQAFDVCNSLHVQKSETLNAGATAGQSCVTQNNGLKVDNISSAETGLGVMIGNSEEQSQNKSQKRAGAAALPLLALFFQQLKSKPKPVKLVPKSDDPLLSKDVKSQPEPVNTVSEPDAAGSACSSEGSASPSTSIVLKPNSTHPSESCTQLINTNTSLTLIPISSNKRVEDTILDPPSEDLTSLKTDDLSVATFPEIQTSSLSPETHTSLSTTTPTDTPLTTNSEDLKSHRSLTSASEVLVNHSIALATSSPLSCDADGSASAPGTPSSPGFSHCSPAPSSDQEPVDNFPDELHDIPQVGEQGKGDEETGGTGVASLVINSSNQLSVGKRPKGRPRKQRKCKQPEEPLLVGGPTDVRMHPNLEDVEGQLFVSFTSKEALEVHLGDNAEESPLPPHVAKVMEKKVESPEAMAERIASLEKALLQDLKVMKYKQVIHPVLQEVGLKLNILDQIMAIDLVYLGVELPIPPPPPCPGASSGGVSSQLHFVSRTGKTTDITKIKGWRDKFVSSDTKETPSEGGTSTDAALKNRSAFCSDMLDEYLASEGKLIDERVASFSTSSVTPVSYQMPTKSSSYVRTLDSVLKKRGPGSFTPTLKSVPSAAPISVNNTAASQTKKPKVPPKHKEPQKLGGSTSRRSSRTSTPKANPTTTHPPSSTTATQDAAASKKLSSKVKGTSKAPSTLKSSKSETTPVKTLKKEHSNSVSQAGHSVPPTVVKLLEVEDGAVWEGKDRTFVTEERASIALAALACATGVSGGSKAFMPIIKRRAPPCLRVHCRLGCVCASLVQERRNNNCGKPECMLGCHCLRHKVVLLKPKQEEVSEGSADSPLSQTLTEDEEGSIKMKRKKKKKKKSVAYVLTDPPATSEPATRVRTLWKSAGTEPEQDELHIPTPVYLPCPLRYDTQPDSVDMANDESTMTCARIRPLEAKTSKEPNRKEENTSVESAHDWTLETGTESRLNSEEHSKQEESGHVDEPEPGEYTHGPSKRLEVVSECKWDRRTDRTYIMRVLCEHMDKDRLKTPFWIGKYRIQPISQTIVDEGQGPCTNYKVLISQPQLSLLREKIQTCVESQPPAPPAERAVPAPPKPAEPQTPAPAPRPEQKAEPGQKPEPRPEKKAEAGQKPEPMLEQKAEPGQKPQPRPEKKAEPTPNPKPIEPLPKLRPDQGLPFLAGVPKAGLLIAQPKAGESCPITVNGKVYPKARLQLGHMGALHPANRLAAYITGRLDPVNLPGYRKSQDQATSTANNTVTTAANDVVIASGTKATAKPLGPKTTVTKPTVGKVYTQFVVNQLCSQQQKLPFTGGAQLLGSVQKVVLSSNPMVVVGQRVGSQSSQKEQGAGGTKGPVIVTLSPSKQAPQKGSVGSLVSSATTVVTTTTTTTTTPTTSGGSSGEAPQLQKILPQQQVVMLPGPGVRAVAPASIGAKNVVGNRILLQPVRTSSGATLYRNPNGQLVQLVPLSQLRNLKPNLVLKDQKAFVRLPSPGVLGAAPRGPIPNVISVPLTNTSGATQVSTTPTCSSSVTSVSNQKLVTTSAVTSAGSVTSTSPPKAAKVISLPGSSTFAIKTFSPAARGAPEFLGNTGTHTVRIVPTGPGTQGLPLAQGASKIVPSSGGFTLLGPGNVSVAPISNKPPLVLFVEKPPAVAAVEKLATDKPSPVPGLDKPSTLLLVDNSKTVSAQDKAATASGPSSLLVLDQPSAVLPSVKTPEVQELSDKAPNVSVNKDKPPTSAMVEAHSMALTKDGCLLLGTDKKLTSVISSISAPAVTLQGKKSISAIPGSDKLSEGPVLDKSHVVPASSKSATASVQSKQESSTTDTTAEGSVDSSIDLATDNGYPSNSKLTCPAEQRKLTSCAKDTPSGDGMTLSTEASNGSSDVSKPFLAFRSNHGQGENVTPSDESLLFKEILDLTPQNPAAKGVETIHIDSDNEDTDCIVVAEKKAAMEEGEIGSDVEILGDSLVLTEDSDDDSDSDESICVISDSGETENSDEDNTIDIETVDESNVSNNYVMPKNKARPKSAAIFERARRLEGHKHNERLRRNQMKQHFGKLRQSLNLQDPKTSRLCIITEASKRIRQLETEGFYLRNEKDALIQKQKEYLKRISESSGKSEGTILKKLQDISSRQKQVEEQRKRKQQLSDLPLPKELMVCAPLPSCEASSSPTECHPGPKPLQPQRPASPSTYQSPLLPRQPEKRIKIIPNILSKRSKVNPVEPKAVPPPVLPSVFSVVNPMLPGQQIITMSNPLHSLVPLASLSSLTGHKSSTPGVAAVSIRVPAVPKVIQLEGGQTLRSDQPSEVDKPAANVSSLPKISKVMSLVPPMEILDTTSNTTAQEKTSADSAVCVPLATVSSLAPQSTAELEEGEVPDGPLTMVQEIPTHRKASADLEDDEDDGEEEEARVKSTKDPTLMSLLSEIVFLNQQSVADGSKPHSPDDGLPPEPGEVLLDQPAGASVNDERSLSPLFLRLDDEETSGTTPSKSSPTQKPQTGVIEPVGEAVRSEPTLTVVPSSGSTPLLTTAPVLSMTTNGQSQTVASSTVKGDTSVPPPLLQMKAGSVAPPVRPSLKENVSWRPMPKLVPLGLKTTPPTSLSRGTGSSR